ncbi:MAG: hypothetical protein U1D55_11410 [Phycisphaerae bacterium]
MWNRTNKRTYGRPSADIQELLAAWKIVAVADGRVSIKAQRRQLGYVDIQSLLERLGSDSSLDGVEFTFDFSAVEQISAPWTMALAHLVAFARKHRGRCRVIVDSGQPAAVATMALRAVSPTLLTLERGSRRVA